MREYADFGLLRQLSANTSTVVSQTKMSSFERGKAIVLCLLYSLGGFPLDASSSYLSNCF